MKKSILVTGISGAGKSSLSGKLQEMGYSAYDIDNVPDLFTMLDKETRLPVENYEHDNLTQVQQIHWICNKKMLESIIERESKEIAFYCGAASNMNEILSLFDQIILLRAAPDITRHRLTIRTTNKHNWGRTKTVQDWILDDKDRWEDEILGKGAILVDSNRPLDEVAEEVTIVAVSEEK